jgi:predicted DNA-binding transcriptional regulator AlpA
VPAAQPTKFALDIYMNESKKLFDENLLTAAEIIAKLRIAKSTFYSYLKNGDFPPAISIGARSKRWLESDFEAYLRRNFGR